MELTDQLFSIGLALLVCWLLHRHLRPSCVVIAGPDPNRIEKVVTD